MSDDHRSELARAVREVEACAAELGWDGPFLLFALVPTAAWAAPDLLLTPSVTDTGHHTGTVHGAGKDTGHLTPPGDGHLTPLLQDQLPSSSYDTLLNQIAWPEEVVGAAVVMERLFLSTDDGATYTEKDLALTSGLQEMRVAVGVTRDGQSWCVLRLRQYDDAALRLQSADAAPAVIEALRASFRPVAD